jgi:hypothetical protein
VRDVSEQQPRLSFQPQEAITKARYRLLQGHEVPVRITRPSARMGYQTVRHPKATDSYSSMARYAGVKVTMAGPDRILERPRPKRPSPDVGA